MAERARRTSERHDSSAGYTTAVDLCSFQFHNEVTTLVAVAHSLESLVVEHLTEGAQRDGTMEIAIGDELGLYLGCGEEMHSARLLAHRTGNFEIDIEQFLLGSVVGKLLDILAQLLNLVGGKPIDEAIIHQFHRLGIETAVVDGMIEGRVDALDIEGEESAVARLVGEKLELVARGTIRGYAHTAFLGAAVGGSDIDIGSGDERLEIIEIGT